MSQLTSVLEREQRSERGTALRHLLAHPLTLASDAPEIFLAVLRHREWLTSWFADHAGWRLQVEPNSGFARLNKIPASVDETRAARLDGRPDLDRRRYALLSMTLAAFEEAGPQTTLASLADRVTELSREDPELPAFDSTSGTDRRAFVDALRMLICLGVLRVRDGDTERYAQSTEGDALFDLQQRLLPHLISAPQPPAFAGAPDRLLDEVWPDTEEGHRLRHRHQTVRRLLDDPVLYFEDLSPDALGWLDPGRGYLYRILEDDAGFAVERRAEGLAAIDPSGVTADTSFPDGGSTVKHAAILLAEQFVQLRTGPSKLERVPLSAAIELVQKLHRDFGELSHWSKQYPPDEEGCTRLTIESLELLASFGLVSTDDGGWRIRPAIARFRPGAPTRRRSGSRPRST